MAELVERGIIEDRMSADSDFLDHDLDIVIR